MTYVSKWFHSKTVYINKIVCYVYCNFALTNSTIIYLRKTVRPTNNNNLKANGQHAAQLCWMEFITNNCLQSADFFKLVSFIAWVIKDMVTLYQHISVIWTLNYHTLWWRRLGNAKESRPLAKHEKPRLGPLE